MINKYCTYEECWWNLQKSTHKSKSVCCMYTTFTILLITAIIFLYWNFNISLFMFSFYDRKGHVDQVRLLAMLKNNYRVRRNEQMEGQCCLLEVPYVSNNLPLIKAHFISFVNFFYTSLCNCFVGMQSTTRRKVTKMVMHLDLCLKSYYLN